MSLVSTNAKDIHEAIKYVYTYYGVAYPIATSWYVIARPRISGQNNYMFDNVVQCIRSGDRVYIYILWPKP